MKTFTTLTTIAIIVLLPLSAIAVEDPAAVSLKEEFAGSSIASPWQAGGKKNSFVIEDGVLRGTAAPDDSHGPSIGAAIKGQDLRVQFDFRSSNPGYFLFLIDGDSQFQGQAHLLRFAATGNQIQLMQDRGDPDSKRDQKIERDQRGGKRVPPTPEQLADPNFYRIERLAQHPAKVSDGKWHHVQIEVRGNDVSAQLDGKPVMKATATVLDVPKTRIVFLVGNAGTIHVDNVLVENLSREPASQS